MRWILFLVFNVVASVSFAQLDELRTLYFNAIGVEGIKAFYIKATTVDESNPLLKAYKGVAIAMYAEAVDGVSDKIDYFNRGKALIEDAVTKDWYNSEIRYLRFSVQSEVPFFLGYSSKLEEDADVVIDAFSKSYIDKNNWFWKRAIQVMLNSNDLRDDQEKKLRQYAS